MSTTSIPLPQEPLRALSRRAPMSLNESQIASSIWRRSMDGSTKGANQMGNVLPRNNQPPSREVVRFPCKPICPIIWTPALKLPRRLSAPTSSSSQMIPNNLSSWARPVTMSAAAMNQPRMTSPAFLFRGHRPQHDFSRTRLCWICSLSPFTVPLARRSGTLTA